MADIRRSPRQARRMLRSNRTGSHGSAIMGRGNDDARKNPDPAVAPRRHLLPQGEKGSARYRAPNVVAPNSAFCVEALDLHQSTITNCSSSVRWISEKLGDHGQHGLALRGDKGVDAFHVVDFLAEIDLENDGAVDQRARRQRFQGNAPDADVETL